MELQVALAIQCGFALPSYRRLLESSAGTVFAPCLRLRSRNCRVAFPCQKGAGRLQCRMPAFGDGGRADGVGSLFAAIEHRMKSPSDLRLEGRFLSSYSV